MHQERQGLTEAGKVCSVCVGGCRNIQGVYVGGTAEAVKVCMWGRLQKQSRCVWGGGGAAETVKIGASRNSQTIVLNSDFRLSRAHSTARWLLASHPHGDILRLWDNKQ